MLAGIAGIYLAACCIAAGVAGWREWRLVPAVAAAFATIHLAWGAGMWWGLVAPPPPSVEAR
jgi:hypothetical protein